MMGDDSLMEILFFALVAAFLCHRLWLVLGRRNGETPPARPDPFTAQKRDATLNFRENPVVSLPDQSAPLAISDDPVSLEGSIARLKAADPAFDEKQFTAGAKAAFQMIVTNFAAGDRQSLRPLLGEDVYRSFERAISERETQNQHLQTTVQKVDVDIESVRLTGTVARLTVGFRSTQINVLYGADGSIIEGDPRRAENVADVWIFARDTKSRDPNWTLVETRHQA